MRSNRRLKPGQRQPAATKAIRAGGRRLREVSGILMVALTALILLSLISWSADDLAGHTQEQPVRNWVGPFGARLADALVQLLGWAVWLTPVLTFYLALILFIPARERAWRRLARVCGLLLMILVLAAAPPALSTGDPFYRSNTLPGGILGQAVGGLLADLFGGAGAVVLLAALLPVGLILATGLSLQQLGGYLGSGWSWTRTNFFGWLEGFGGAKTGPRPPRAPRAARPGNAERRPEIVEKPREIRIAQPVQPPKQTQFNFKAEGDFQLPPLSLLQSPPPGAKKASHDTLLMNSRILEKKLGDFGIEGQVTHVHPGPVITMYEYAPAPGVKVSRIANLQDDLALAMSAISVRVVAPIPGKNVVGIEIPNSESEMVYLLEVLGSDDFKKSKSKLAFALGKDIFGHPVVGDLAKMPHLLIAGATGSGKSIMLNTLICSVLFRATPDEVRFLLIDPKMVEMTPYEGIPHLITPVVTNPKKASWALRNVVTIMEERYRILAEKDAKSIEGYNQLLKEERKAGGEGPMPYLLIVIDELADLMMLASSDVEDSVTRLAQMARAVGIHLVLATQRPSVNVITGVIKANLPTRISFQVSSKMDSRVIMDTNGAEQLLGRGDMLFLPPGASKLRRIHGAYIAESEIRQVVEFIKAQRAPDYDESLLRPAEDSEDGAPPEGEEDEKYREAVELVQRTGQASISMIQRRLRVGYNRAARMVEMMEQQGIITPPDGIKPRRTLGRMPE